MVLRYTQNLPPREIAKQLKCSVEQVYAADRRLKGNYLKATSTGMQLGGPRLNYFYKHHILQSEDPLQKHLVHAYVEEEGIYNLKCGRIQEALGASMQTKPPSLKAISHILRKDFHLRFHRVEGALVHYKNPDFDEKRLWICRLLS